MPKSQKSFSLLSNATSVCNDIIQRGVNPVVIGLAECPNSGCKSRNITVHDDTHMFCNDCNKVFEDNVNSNA